MSNDKEVEIMTSLRPVGEKTLDTYKRELARNPEYILIPTKDLKDLVDVANAALSVLSEEGVKEYLSAYVMGVELINRLEALESE